MYKWIFSPYQVRYHKQYYASLRQVCYTPTGCICFLTCLCCTNLAQRLKGCMVFTSIGVASFFMYCYMLAGWWYRTYPRSLNTTTTLLIKAWGHEGAVSAVLFSFIIINPLRIGFILPILSFPAIVWGVAYLAYEYYASKRQSDNISHDAHVLGAVFGVVFTILSRPVFLVELVNQ